MGSRACALAVLLGAGLGGARSEEVATTRSVFFVGGHYVGAQDAQVMDGAMYVERIAPARPTHPLPLVFFHGAGQTATNWLTTPDGRRGWADEFARLGYVVYLVDQPARGRSAYHPGLDGPLRAFTAPALESTFTATESLGTWPRAKAHTQWPGTGERRGRRGDPVFDAFYASQVEYLASNADTQRLVQAAGAALLDRIGPAILVTHSQAGPFGWLLADARPALVRAIVALEPSGPPFEEAIRSTGPARAWGLADIPLTYDPPAAQAADLRTAREERAEGPDLVPCRLQAAPARRLPRLAGIPVAVVTSESSYHAGYDHCTVAYLKQAGVDVTFKRLEDEGIRGNGHMMMMELNNLDITRSIDRWLGSIAP
ncbi:hypothetical protein A5481_13600 [Methylobacterium platani]|uniref:AB hydrolase-1 domain-containing protein n=2 Tax=Methylobacterium platani TaxID=427683 RepID=A0A179SD86_9HYPH|nr:hypothetical protein A5481_13600 [Methylobacterium platani]